MNWVKAERSKMRSDIEMRAEFVGRNVQWWWETRHLERGRRKKYYEKFLDFANIQTDSQMIVGEVGPGPFGGIIEVCNLPAYQKVFIDYIMEDLFNLKFIKWPDNSTFVDAPAEKIPLEDNYVDILLSYNALDHGWDVYKCIEECVRISKRCYLAFDCRGDNEDEVAIRKDGHDLDHFQLLKYEDIARFVSERDEATSAIWRIRDMESNKQFPIAFIMVEKR